MQGRISILGCGWLGLPLGRFLASNGYTVKGSVTGSEKFSLLTDAGIEPYQVLLSPELTGSDIKEFFNCDILIVNFPPKRRDDIEVYHPAQIAALIREIEASGIQKILFVSSTSVYPDVNREVFESDDLEPLKGSGKALRIAEEMLKKQHFQTTILRFAGLVAEDRQPGKFLAGKINVPNAEAPVNLIHRDDCIKIIHQIIEQNVWAETFNACADKHPARQEFYVKAAIAAGLEPPSFLHNDDYNFKIINSDKLKKALRYEYIFPDPLDMITEA